MTTFSYIRSLLVLLFMVVMFAFAFTGKANAQEVEVEGEQTEKTAKTCLELMSVGQRNNDFFITTFNRDDIDVRDYGPDYLAQSITYVKFWLFNLLGCARQDVNFGTGPTGRAQSRCRNISEKMPNSMVCYVESNLGYFLVHTDYLNNIVLQFHRWD